MPRVAASILSSGPESLPPVKNARKSKTMFALCANRAWLTKEALSSCHQFNLPANPTETWLWLTLG